MIKIIGQLLLISAMVYFLEKFLSNFTLESYQALGLFAFAILLANWIAVPILKFIAFPVNLLTLGLLNTFIGVAAIYIISQYVPGVNIQGEIGLNNMLLSLVVISSTTSFVYKLLD